MERFNPFSREAAGAFPDEPDPFATSPIRSALSSGSGSKQTPTSLEARNSSKETRPDADENLGQEDTERQQTPAGSRHGQISLTSRYSTSFPDPFGPDELPAPPPPLPPADADVGPFSQQRVPLQSRPQQSIPVTGGGGASKPVSASASTPASSTNRSNSVTFLHHNTSSTTTAADDADRQQQQPLRGTRHPGGGGGFSSFLSRATSVTSSTVTDRVSGAVGSVRNAVDSLSSQLQSATTNVVSSSEPASSHLMMRDPSQQHQQQQQPQPPTQSAASYLASKFTSATNQFSSSASQAGAGPMPVICRQRVVLILDGGQSSAAPPVDWPAQFNQYRRLIAGLPPTASGSNALTSFFASQFASAVGSAGAASSGSASSSSSAVAGQQLPQLEGGAGAANDLIEQVDFRDVSVLANQSSSTAAIYVRGGAGAGLAASGKQQQQQQQAHLLAGGTSRTIRPEFVVVRERCKPDTKLDHLGDIVKALSYCSVAMFEPYEIWHTFQDRQLIFARLLRVQRALGKEQFPLIPQIYCQTHQDLLNYINCSSITLPCLVRTGHLGKGKIRCDSLQMLKDLASIMATSGQSCTIEQYLEVKYDLVIQRLGTSLKLFKRNTANASSAPTNQRKTSATSGTSSSFDHHHHHTQQGPPYHHHHQSKPYNDEPYGGQQATFAPRQSASRQTSLGSSVLSSLISSTSSQQQQQQQQQQAADRRASSSGPAAFERLSEVGVRYRNWVEAISREFDNKLEAFSIRIAVASNDREYIVGLRNCSMGFLGNQDNQDEDRRSFVELIITRMNTQLARHEPISREPSLTAGRQLSRGPSREQQQPGAPSAAAAAAASSSLRRTSSDGEPQTAQLGCGGAGSALADKTTTSPHRSTYSSQTELGTGVAPPPPPGAIRGAGGGGGYGQLNNRSKSVSMNQSDFMGAAGARTGMLASSGPIGDQPAQQASPFGRDYATTGAGPRTAGGLLRRGSDRSDSALTDESPNLTGGSQSSSAAGGSHQRQGSLGQSFFDQTSTAFSSLQKQSMSFFKRLDARGNEQISSTPPQSAKSDIGFDRDFGRLGGGAGGGGYQQSLSQQRGAKSQSMDASTLESSVRSSPRRETPPKPPPPQSMINRQSSLASYSSQRAKRGAGVVDVTTTPHTTPTQSRQNSAIGEPTTKTASNGSINLSGNNQYNQARGRVVRQNSALSAFEPFDPDLKGELNPGSAIVVERDDKLDDPVGSSSIGDLSDRKHSQVSTDNSIGRSRGGNVFDTTSTTSGDSNSTNETTTAEDTMNNLKKTFASIFGDKCE